MLQAGNQNVWLQSVDLTTLYVHKDVLTKTKNVTKAQPKCVFLRKVVNEWWFV